MYSICATKKLLDRLASPIEPVVSRPTTTLGNWYATALFWKPQVALFLNQRTLISVLMPLAPARSLSERFPAALGELLRFFNVDEAFIASETAAMSEPVVSKTESRSLLGVMNKSTRTLDFMHHLDDERTLLRLSAQLADVPSRAEERAMRFPDLALFELLDSFGVRHGENPERRRYGANW
ncbi:MAG: hypothetical protein KGJ39_08560 [Acidobacteriota bacterium]|nr:hypothetical protein [Acidobacteriota bacterium]